MLFNLSVRRAGIILGGVALAAGAIVSAGPAALASTAKPQSAAALCPSNNNKQNGEIVEQVSTVQLWYSPTCRTAWGVIVREGVGSEIEVINSDGDNAISYVTVDGARTVTSAVNDANITSVACGWTPNLTLLGCTDEF